MVYFGLSWMNIQVEYSTPLGAVSTPRAGTDLELAALTSLVCDVNSWHLYIKNEINIRIKELKQEQIDNELENLEKIKNDSNKYHAVMREMRRKKHNEALLVTDDEGKVAGSTETKLTLIRQHFKNALAPNDMQEEIKEYEPCKMRQPFTGEEIKKAAKKLKNGKSAGADQLNPEFIKYAPPTIHNKIADIYNDTAETGQHPEQLTYGLLAPLPKLGKKKGPTVNLRPIILLSVIRKILTICMLDRIWTRLAEKIPKSQAAYQGGRSTTEQVLALKLLCERAITSSDQDLYILLLDMSKAFDTVNRRILLQDLENILEKDEIHIISLLTNRPTLAIFLENETSENFETYQGICQGDCLSAILFIYYLSFAVKDQQIPDATLFMDILYADDMTYATTEQSAREKIKKEIPEKLEKYNLGVNMSKTEESEAPDNKQPPHLPHH